MPRSLDDKLMAIVDRFENSHVVLKISSSKNNITEIPLPMRYLPKNVKEGDVLHVKFFTENESTMEHKAIAKHLLNEILNNN